MGVVWCGAGVRELRSHGMRRPRSLVPLDEAKARHTWRALAFAKGSGDEPVHDARSRCISRISSMNAEPAWWIGHEDAAVSSATARLPPPLTAVPKIVRSGIMKPKPHPPPLRVHVHITATLELGAPRGAPRRRLPPAARLLPAERCSAGAAVEAGRRSSRAVGRSRGPRAPLSYARQPSRYRLGGDSPWKRKRERE